MDNATTGQSDGIAAAVSKNGTAGSSTRAGLCLAVALAICAVVFVRYSPRLSHWQGLDVPGALERPEFGRAKVTLDQVADPWRPVTAPLHTVINWRLGVPVLWHYLRLAGPLLLAMPGIGCVLTLWLVAAVTFRHLQDWWGTWLATALMGALPWFFVSSGWLLHFDSWLVLGLLTITFVRSRPACVAVCLAIPWIDERFILALPVCLAVRAVCYGEAVHSRVALDPRRFQQDLLIILAAILPYLAIRAIAWLQGDAVATGYVQSHWKDVQSLSWRRVLEGLWSGYRAGWLMILAGLLLVPRSAGQVRQMILALVTVGTAVGSQFMAMDMSRSLMMIGPVLVLGMWQWETWRQGRWRMVLPCVVALNYLLPATHVMWNQKIDIAPLPVEIHNWFHPPDFFAAARLIQESDELIAAGQVAEGSAKLDEAIRLDRRYPNAFVKRAALRMSEGDYTAAEPDLHEGLALDADNATGNFLLGVVLASQKNLPTAVDRFRHALAHAPPNWPARQEAEQFLREATAALEQR